MPLSKDPSPNCSDVTSVKVAKTPNLVPFLYDLDNSSVVPTSPAKYSPYEIFASKGINFKYIYQLVVGICGIMMIGKWLEWLALNLQVAGR